MDIEWLKKQFPDLVKIEILKDGGQKIVFSALDAEKRNVVLKLIRPNVNFETIRREILAVQLIDSGRVPEIYRFGKIDSQIGECFWMIEERILGKNIREILHVGPLDFKAVLKLGLHVLEALEKAEQKVIVHRDVKPDNIICDSNNDFWLIDFGIARHLQLESQTETTLSFGKFTLGYAPPEQLRNMKKEITSQADLFAVGITLYECICGKNPFRYGARNDIEIMERVEKMKLPPLQMSFKSAPEFQNLLNAMTQKRRDHRPPSVNETVEWMREICRIELIC